MVRKNLKLSQILLPLGLTLFTAAARAEVDMDAAENKARVDFMDRFTKFSGDKNVVGKARKAADGKRTASELKKKYNKDDGSPYESDLTYHDLAFNTVETEKADGNDPNKKKVSRLFSFVSPHGGISAAGGSSQLERTAYGLHKKFVKEEEEEKGKKDDEKTGTKFRSIFKITTQEIIEDEDAKNGGGKNPGQGGQAAQAKNDADKKKEPEKVERFEIREEAKPEIEKIGEESFETVRRAGRDKGNENDESTLANGVLLRYAAGEASQAMWNSTLANLFQRRVNRGVQAKQFPDTPQLSEVMPNCEAWSAAANGVLAKVKDQKDRKALQEEIKRMGEQCGQLAQQSYKTINPRFESGKDGKDELKTGDLKKEDGFVRDSRVQLEILNSAGKDPRNVPSNWKYSDQDAKARVTVGFDDNAQPKGEEDRTVTQQLDSYNNQLKEAAKGYDEVKTRFPQLATPSDAPLKYQIQPETKSVMEINQSTNGILGEDGIKVSNEPAAQDYGTLTGQSQN